jgi:hypothetical protein
MNGPPKPGRNPHDHPLGRLRDRAHQQLHSNLKKVPGIEQVRFEESGTGVEYQIGADVNTDVFASGEIPSDEASLKVNWWPQADKEAWFEFHYWDGTGYDCGWHREPNDHVDGLAHFQERESAGNDYEYEPFSVGQDVPVGILWTIADEKLVKHLLERYG